MLLFYVALMRLGPKLNPLFPGVLVAVAAGLVVPFLGLDAGPQIGAVPQVLLPPLQLTLPWAEVPRLLVPAVIIALVGWLSFEGDSGRNPETSPGA